MKNSSDTIVSTLKTVSLSLDTLGSTGFAYAFQDKIVSLYNTDEYVDRIAKKIEALQDNYNAYIQGVFTTNNLD